jgi:hypothetical protein
MPHRDLRLPAGDGGAPCAAPDSPEQPYDLPLHAAAVGILLGVSLLGSLGPVALRLSSSSGAVTVAIRLGTYFGGSPCSCSLLPTASTITRITCSTYFQAKLCAK